MYHYYCSIERIHRLTKCIHERCRLLDYKKRWWDHRLTRETNGA